jgi:hypothetical protein
MAKDIPIFDISELDDKSLIKLFDRVQHILLKMKELEKIYDHLPDLSRILDPMSLLSVYTAYISVCYRSLFQSSAWEEKLPSRRIDYSAYFKQDESWREKHKKITDFINKDIAHQDTASKTRGIYPPFKMENKKTYSVYQFAPNIFGLEINKMLAIISHKIETTYESKTGEKLEILVH